MDLAAIKVSIGLQQNGQHLYPAFGALPVVQASGVDWSTYVDTFGSGWLYDACCGHRVATPESPLGQQWGILLVPLAFALQAVAAFPLVVARLTEAELTAFYNAHCHSMEPDQFMDLDVLQGIAAKRSLNLPAEPWEADALNPNHPMRGIRANRAKRWAGYKALTNTVIV